MPLEAGVSLGRFRLLRRLGAGGMGEVFLAEDPRIGRHVAIKAVRFEGTVEKVRDASRRLEVEAMAAGRLVHPHVVTLYDAGEADGLFFLAFEYVEGEDLSARLRRPPPPTLADVLRWARQTASALDAAHGAGIVHRDVKPSNLLLTVDGRVKVADFGIAKIAEGDGHLTRTGSVVGTLLYASPEQVRGEILDGRSDLYSLGVVLYQVLARRLPFEQANLPALVHQILTRDPEPLATLRPDLPPRLATAVSRLLAKDREERFPTAAALEEEIRAVESGLGEGVPTVTSWGASPSGPPAAGRAVEDDGGREQRTRGALRLRRSGLLASTILAAVLLPGIAWMAFLPRPRPPRIDDEPLVPAGAGVSPGPSRAPTVSPSAAPTAARVREQPPEAPAPIRRVGTVVTFLVAPGPAATGSILRVDGLVRGPAAGSIVTLRPGPHRIEIAAEGHEPFVLDVEARTGLENPTLIEAVLRRR